MRTTAVHIVANSSVLIALGRLDKLNLLTMLSPPILVTATVWDEVTVDPTKPGVAAIERARRDNILEVISMGDKHAYPLDEGESATLSAAAELGAAVIIDERRARRLWDNSSYLREHVPALLGTAGLIVRAKHEGLVSSARPLLDDLCQGGFRISPTVYEKTLRDADEWPP